MSMGNVHTYAARLAWEGNSGEGTASYEGYGRSYRVLIEGKPELIGTADPAFRGDASRHNPEDLFLAAISACHMLTYLALCARSGVRVIAYTDEAEGRMVLTGDGGGRFEEVSLRSSRSTTPRARRPPAGSTPAPTISASLRAPATSRSTMSPASWSLEAEPSRLRTRAASGRRREWSRSGRAVIEPP